MVPNMSWAMLAVGPSSFMCAIRCSAKALSFPLAEVNIATITSAVGKTDNVMYADAAAPEFRLASK